MEASKEQGGIIHDKQKVITISRQFGSGGRTIGKRSPRSSEFPYQGSGSWSIRWPRKAAFA